ncbi:MAG: arylsulfatase [Gemmataceae bacterium]|nr:arylsulfatase [Gemmataceae bacterium]
MGSRVVFCGLLFFSLAFPSWARQPNIVIILSDDMGFSDLGCFGGEILTPNLNRLAEGGLRFTQFYNTARCCPTRASLLTGLYPHQAGIGHMMNETVWPGYKGDLNANTPTIAEVLGTAGYRNYAVGKWHVTRHTGEEASRHNWPLQRGFHHYYGTLQGGGSFFDPYTLTRDNTPISAFADPQFQPKKFYYTDAIAHHASRFIVDHHQNHGDKPLFLYAAFTAAHWPMHALEEDIAKYKGKYAGGFEPIRKARLEKARKLGVIDAAWPMSATTQNWDALPDKAWEARCMEVYAAMIDRLDQGIGRIVQALKSTGEFENTLIFFLQDNGGCAEGSGRTGTKEHPEEARLDKPTLPAVDLAYRWPMMIPKSTRDGFPVLMGKKVMPGGPDTWIAYGPGWANVSNTPFREFKHWVHEGGISTPLIAHWLEGIKAPGELRHQPGHLIDLMATCIDVGGAQFPARRANAATLPPEGKSLVPAFANKPLEREALYWEHEGNRAIRKGDWKLVAKGPNGKWELYDLKTDRVELNDLASENPKKVSELSTQWEKWAYRAKVLPWIWGEKEGTKKGKEKKKQ